jgi:hypothetical protein
VVPILLSSPDSCNADRAAFAEQGTPPPISIRCPYCGERVDFWPPDTGEESAADCGGCGRSIKLRLGSPA